MTIKILFRIIFSIFLLINITTCEYRSINGVGNNQNYPADGIPKTPFVREVPENFLFGASSQFQMVPTPGNYGTLDPKANCADALPPGNFPLPRCVSNKVAAMALQDSDPFNFERLQQLEKFKSKRKNSHILTYWAFFVRMDIITSPPTGENFPQGVYIPLDDATYLSNYHNGPPTATTFGYAAPAFQFNRSLADGNHVGVNTATSFLDASTIYGNSDADLQLLRDKDNNGRMKVATYQTPDGQFGYPLSNANGDFVIGIKSATKNVFTDTFTTIFLREHNRLCGELHANHTDWDDEKLFQEARRWVIAFMQKITYYEYLGTALGVPIPPYKGYNPTIRPIIDTFFASVTFRYGHSEISDFYNILSSQGDLVSVLSLHDLKSKGLLLTYGVPSMILSLALQRQEEVDIYFSEFMRSYHSTPTTPAVDIAALDIVRSRDHGIPSYNDARKAFGLQPKRSFEEISSDPEVQQRLKNTYATVEQIEPLMGGLAEDHINGGNYGELISASFNYTWTRLRDSDRFWYENKEVSGFSDAEISVIQTTTLLQIIERNTPSDSVFPTNLWFVQPLAYSQPTSLANKNYGYNVLLTDGFNMQWRIDGSDVAFLITVSSTNSWFGIGFNPNGAAMKDTDMMIFQNDGNSSVISKNYVGVGRAVKPVPLADNEQFLKVLDGTNVGNGITTIEVRRPLNVKNKKTLTGSIEMVYAWNFNSREFAYHGGNRGTKIVNLLTGESSGFLNSKEKGLFLMHGIVMFSIWGVLFPISVWIVRYLRHIDSYMSQHRNLNLLGGAAVAAFGAVAMSTVDFHASSPHGIMGLIVFTITGVQVALGLLAIWALANVESAATGIVRHLRHLHFYLGGALLLAAWANIYLGMIQFDTKFSGNGANRPYIWAYTAWLVLFGFIITVSEFYYNIRNMQFLWPARKGEVYKDRITRCIPEDVFENLPAITWNEFNQRVMTGASLVIAEGLAFDIHKWIPIHPGGQKILRRVVGTDITNDFFFDPSVVTVINKNFNNEYENEKASSLSVLTDNSYRGNFNQKESSNKPDSVANAVDMINATAFKKQRVAMHRHSKFATSKLASMVIARVIDPVDEGISIHSPSISSKQSPKTIRDINISILSNTNDVNELQQPQPYSPNIFRRYILINIETVSRSDSEKPVKKFTFQVIHPKDRLPKFLPGDYIEIMSEANNHVVIRPYTPLQGPTENSFCILVKIYKDGAMSQHLSKQLRNFEIKVRGPFDIADRMLQPSSPILKGTSISSRPTSPSIISPLSTSAYSTGNDKLRPHLGISRGTSVHGGYGGGNVINHKVSAMLEGRTGILLNKDRDDLCWDHLFMVCGGTGITPMLQLIQYHMDKATSGSKFNLYLLNANDTIADLIQPQYLDYLCTVLKGKLKITYILSKPPPIWRGLTGQIDDTLLFDWISQNYSVPPPAIPPRLSNYGSAGGSNTNSVISNIKPRYGRNPIHDFEEFEDIIENQDLDGNPSQQQQQHYQQQHDQMYDPYRNNRGPSPIPFDSQSEDPRFSFNSQSLPYYFSPNNNNLQHTSELILLNERHNYMRSLAMDNTTQLRVAVCGNSKFNESIRKSLEKLGFPIDEKALIIN